ncbi:MAG: ankyrin repeat domain-containing protein [Chlamydiia bacterium]|nr:ankyrin repeat domain-containing protein [Chlamydiia bacterium]
MSVRLSIEKRSTEPVSVDHYELKDLLEESKIEVAIEYLKKCQPSREVIVQFLDTLIENKNTTVINLLIKAGLICSQDIEYHIPRCEWLLEYYVHELSQAVEHQQDEIFNFLSSVKLFDKALSKFPDKLNKPVLQKLLTKKKLFSPQIKNLIGTSLLHNTLVEILEEALLSDLFFIVNHFKSSSILDGCVQKAVQEKNVRALKKLIKEELIKVESINAALLQDVELQASLKEEFKIACIDSKHNQIFIRFMINAGIQFDDQDIYEVAKLGDYPLLKSFLDKGADVSQAVFQLIEYNQQGSIRGLLEGNYDKGRLSPNLKNREGNTLLIEAVKQDQSSLIEILLSYGANPLILDNQGASVFELSRGQSLRTRQLLYNPKQVQMQFGRGGTGWNNGISVEEKALEGLLKRKACGHPIATFYCLFIKVHDFALAVLKSSPFSKNMLESYSESQITHAKNRIHCWISSSLLPIPEEFAVNHTTMHTVAFAVVRANQSTNKEDIVEIDKQRFTWVLLSNDYKTRNPDIDYGFKYSYQGLQTHGHGRNPEAARSAFKEHREGVRLSHWVTIPDLSADKETLARFNEQISKMFDIEENNSGKLTELVERVDDFIQQTESIIESPYRTTSRDTELVWKEDRFVEQLYNPLNQELRNTYGYTFNERRLEEWQLVIREQIKILQELEKKLKAANPMTSSSFEIERDKVDSHLRSIKDLVVHRITTSAEVPTLKIYTSSLLIEDIFEPSLPSNQAMKRAMCQLIGSMLHRITIGINGELAAHFLEESFREDLLSQLNAEAQFIIQNTSIDDPRSMQELASHLAIFHDTSNMLGTIPPIPLVQSRADFEDKVLEGTMFKHLTSYVTARKILDQFWQDACYSESILKEEEKINLMLNLLNRRLLLMDEELRQEKEGGFLYPLMESRDPKRILDEQLFLLQTSFIIALSYQEEKQWDTPFVQSIIELIQIRLTPAFYGTEKKKHKFDGLYLPYLIDTLPKISELVEVAWQSDPSDSSPFKLLREILHEYHAPEKKEIEESLINAFRSFTPIEGPMTFDSSVSELAIKVRQIKKEIEALIKSFTLTDLESASLVKEIKDLLDQIKKAFDHLQFGKNTSTIAPHQLLEILAHSTVSEGERGRLRENIILRLTNDIRSSVITLLQLTKKVVDLEQMDADKAKGLQKECGQCVRAIEEYLKTEEPQSVSLDFSLFRKETTKFLMILKADETLEKAINKVSIVVDRLSQPEISDIELVWEVQTLINQLNSYFKGKRGKALGQKYASQMKKLEDLINPYLKGTLPLLLNRLLDPLRSCQRALYDVYIQKLGKMEAQLRLGIREQTYYTSQNENISYYLWDGKPFDALPYHTDDDVHIPLTHDQDWSGVQRSYQMRSFVEDQSKAYNEFFGITPPPDLFGQLHVTRIRDYRSHSKRRLAGSYEQKSMASNVQSQLPSYRLSKLISNPKSLTSATKDSVDDVIEKLLTEYPEIAVVLTLCNKAKEKGEDLSLALKQQLDIWPIDIKDSLQSRYGKNLYNQLERIQKDIESNQKTKVRASEYKDFSRPAHLISNTGTGLRCGYYAMGAGILQLSEDARLRILQTIKLDSQCLKENIEEDQYTVGDQLFRYSIRHNEIFTGPVQIFVNTMIAAFNKQQSIDLVGQYDIDGLNKTISQIQEGVGADINIYADRIQILAQHLGVNCYINGGIYGGGELDAPRIDIYNPRGGHYECVKADKK